MSIYKYTMVYVYSINIYIVYLHTSVQTIIFAGHMARRRRISVCAAAGDIFLPTAPDLVRTRICTRFIFITIADLHAGPRSSVLVVYIIIKFTLYLI